MLDWDSFEIECKALQRRSEGLNPDDRWIWKNTADPENKHSSYLQCNNKIRLSSTKINENNDSDDQIEEVEDPAAVQYNRTTEALPIIFDYHIVYSPTYRVPVLYFNAHKPDGALLTLDEIWSELKPTYMTDENKWSFITQGVSILQFVYNPLLIRFKEHPVLGVPFFFIHPCQTQVLLQRIKAMQGEGTRYLLPWLSVFGPIAGIKLPTQIFLEDKLSRG